MEVVIVILLLCYAVTSAAAGASSNCREAALKVKKGVIGSYTPQCNADGSYRKKQCHGSIGHCWCVDVTLGKEITGTRQGPGESTELECGHCNLPSLYFTNKTNILCLPINSTTGTLIGDNPRVLADSKGLIRTIEVDKVNGHIYWGDLMFNNINKANIDGSARVGLFSYAVGYVQGLAVDWSTNILYWTDNLMKLVELSDTRGFNRKVLFKLHGQTEPRGIIVDPTNGYLFWTDWGISPKIERSSLSGSNRKTLVSSSIKWPNDLALDCKTMRIYWVDAYKDLIESVKLDGSMRKTMYTLTYNRPHPYSLAYAVGLELVYWTDWLSNSMYHGGLTKKSKRVFFKEDYKYKSIGQVRVLEQQHHNATRVCENTKCSHLCLKETINTSVCACPTGKVLSGAANNTVCEHASRSYEIYFADSYAESVNHLVKYVGQEGFTIKPLNVPSNEKLDYPLALDYDPYEQMIYWTDKGNNKTYGMHENGTNFRVVLTHQHTASHGIAIDKVSKIIYYFSGGGRNLSAATLDGKFVRTVVAGKFKKARDIALYQPDGLIFFTEYNCVGRVHTNGSGFMCHTGKGAAILTPIGLAIDNVEKRVYWCDSKSYSIKSSDFEFQNVLLVVQKTIFHRHRFWLVLNHGYVIKPYSMAILGEKLFWTDLQKRAIYVADKRGGSNVEYVTGGLDHPRDMHVYSDEVTKEYRKVYKLSFYSRRYNHKSSQSFCYSTSRCGSYNFPEPDACPTGYKQPKKISTVCRNCSDPFGGNFKCWCTDWQTCAQRAYGKIKGCAPRMPFMPFKVRECVQVVAPGVCSYKMLGACPVNALTCVSDNNCESFRQLTKCCMTSCGMKCTKPVQREDNPCTVNSGGCSHFCVAQHNSFQCMCPDGMVINTDGFICVKKNKSNVVIDGNKRCLLPKHVGSCHSPKPLNRWFYNPLSKSCEKFAWGGCSKNENHFQNETMCNRNCRDNLCVHNNGGCSHGCKNHFNQYQCWCPDGMVVGIDGKTCAKHNTTQFSCSYRTGDGRGGGYIEVGYSGSFDQNECYKECIDRKVTNPSVNGVAYLISAKRCFCYKQMKSINSDANYKSCFLKTPKTSISDICALPKHPGSCHSATISEKRWYFDVSSKSCEAFNYSGCDGNKNHFDSKQMCSVYCEGDCVAISSKSTCEKKEDKCSNDQHCSGKKKCCSTPCGRTCNDPVPQNLPKCYQSIKRSQSCMKHDKFWYFHLNSKTCIQSEPQKGDCKVENAFDTEMACYGECSHVICKEERKVGPCKAMVKRWYFNQDSRRCELFYWGGCSRGANNFQSERECQGSCILSPKRNPCDSLDCLNGGVCIRMGRYKSISKCQCPVKYLGDKCDINAEKGTFTITFKIMRTSGKVTVEQVKNQIATLLRNYCLRQITACQFDDDLDKDDNDGHGGRNRRETDPVSSEFTFTPDNIHVFRYADDGKTIVVTFVVIQPNYPKRFLKASALKQFFKSLIGKSVGVSLGLNVVSSTALSQKQRKKGSGGYAVVIIVLIIIGAAAAAAYIFYVKKRNRERASAGVDRVAAVTVDSNQAYVSFENQLYDDLYPENVQLPENHNKPGGIQSFANPAYEATNAHTVAQAAQTFQDDDVACAVAAGGYTNPPAHEKRTIDDWVQFTDDGAPVTGPQFAATGIGNPYSPAGYNIEPSIEGPPPDYTSRSGTPALAIAPLPDFDDLPRYSQITVREFATDGPVGPVSNVALDPIQQRVEFVSPPVDGSREINGSLRLSDTAPHSEPVTEC